MDSLGLFRFGMRRSEAESESDLGFGFVECRLRGRDGHRE